MLRKSVQLLFKTTRRRVSAHPIIITSTPPCSCFHLSRYLLAAMPPVQNLASSSSIEPTTDSSNLKPDECGTIAPVKDIKMPEEEDKVGLQNKNSVENNEEVTGTSEGALTNSCERRNNFQRLNEEFMKGSSDGILTNNRNYDAIDDWPSETPLDEMESREGRRNRIRINEENEDENFPRKKIINWRSKKKYPLDEIESREKSRNQISFNDRNYNDSLYERSPHNWPTKDNYYSEEMEPIGRRNNYMRTDYRDDERSFTRKIVWKTKNKK